MPDDLPAEAPEDAAAPPGARFSALVDARCTHPRCDEPDAYRMTGHCANCGAAPLLVLISARHEKPYGSKCPKCGCDSVRCDRLAGDDEIPLETP